MRVVRCASMRSLSSLDREGGSVDVMWVHGVKRGGGRSVREEDRHHRQVLVTVELSFVLCKNATKCSYSYT